LYITHTGVATDQQLETEMQHDEPVETETGLSSIRVDFEPMDFVTATEEEDYDVVEYSMDAEKLHESEHIMAQEIRHIGSFHAMDAVGLFTSDRLLSPLKHVRAGALSIMFTRMETRFQNKGTDDVFKYRFQTILDKKKEYYKLYLFWKMAPDV